MTNKATEALRHVSRGLLYQSEKDEPFSVFSGHGEKEPTPESLRRLGGHAADAPVESVPLEEFFADLCRDEAWFGAEEKAAASAYRHLLAAVKANLAEPKVFRVGEKDVTIYIIGKTDTGEWAG